MATSTERDGWSEVHGDLYHGIPCRIRVPVAAHAAARDGWRILERIDDVFNVHRPDSELGAINHGGPGTHRVSPWLASCLATARTVEQLSGGAWCATMLPLVRRWRAAVRAGGEPDADDLAAACAAADPRAWRLDGDELRIHHPGVAFDLGGLAKGFAVDLVVAHLAATGIGDHLVQIGGETACRGRAPAGGANRIGIPHPDDPDNAWCAVLTAPGAGLCGSTSGDYRLGQHIIDPRSGRPAAAGIASATCVFRGTGRNALADGLSTALTVLGAPALPALAAAAGCDACVLRRDPQRGLLASATPGWRALLAESD